jgi:long-subunit fatty acid transport protein
MAQLMARHRTAFALIVTSSLAALAAPARGAAYYIGEIGARSTARGGANLVHPADPSAAWLNPAALSFAKGVQLDVDLSLVFLSSSFTRDCAGAPNGCAAPPEGVQRTYTGSDGTSTHTYEVRGDRPPPNLETFKPGPAEPNQLGNLGSPSRFDGVTPITNQAGVQPIPRVMLSFNADALGLDGIAVGAYVFAPNNGDYAFGADTPTRYTLIDRDLLEVYYGIAAAYRYGDWLAVGAGLQLVTAGVTQSAALSADQNSNEDPRYDITARVEVRQDFIPSGNLGVWTNPGRILGIGDLEFAGSVQLPRIVKATGPITQTFGPLFQDEFITPGVISIDAAGAVATTEFELPPFYRVGTRYGHDLGGGIAFDVEADFVYEQWSTYDHVFVSTNGVKVDFTPADDEPGAELAPVVQPKDWQDAWSARVGGTVGLFDRALEIHGGGYYETSAIPNETYSVELVCGDKVGAGIGISGKMFGVRLDVGYMHVFVFDRTVGQESIVFNGSSGDSILLAGADTRTRVAMGKYSAGFDMINVGINVGIDEALGLGKHAAK